MNGEYAEAFPPRFGEWVEGFTLFLFSWILLSVMSGYTVGMSPLFFVLALGMSFWGVRATRKKMKTPITTFLHWVVLAGVGLLIVIGASSVFWGIQGGFDLSADAAPSIAAERIGSHIPSTYAPYFDIPFLYQLGLPVLVAQLPLLPAHVWNWGFGVLGILLFLFWGARWGVRLSGKASAMIWVSVLVLGTRLPFLNLLVGEYPWLLALGLGLGAIWWAEKSFWAGGIGFAALGAIHPYIALNMVFIWVVFARPTLLNMAKTGALALVGLLPIILYQILPLLLSGGSSEGMVIPTLSTLSAIPALVGWVVFGVFGIGMILWGKRTSSIPFQREFLFLFGCGILGFTLGSFFPGLSVASKLLEISLIAAVLGGSTLLATRVSSSHVKGGIVLLLLLSLGVLVTSADMQRLANGSKSTLREAQFAEDFGKKYPELERVVFLSNGYAKMAQFSQKIPLVAHDAHFVSIIALRNTQSPGVKLILQNEFKINMIRETNCGSCVSELDAQFVVVNTQVFPSLVGETFLYEQDGFVVYKMK